MRLQRLTGLEQDKIVGEYKEVMARSPTCSTSWPSPSASPRSSRRADRAEAASSATKLGARRSGDRAQRAGTRHRRPDHAHRHGGDAQSHTGYIKSQPLAEYRAQRAAAAASRRRDQGRRLDRPALHRQHARLDPVLLQPRPRVLAQGLGGAAGHAQLARQADRQHVPAAEGEKITVVLPLTGVPQRPTTTCSWHRAGHGQEDAADDFSNPRKAGIIAVDLDEGDFLIGAALTDGKHDVMLFSTAARRCASTRRRAPDGPQARGVRGMMLEDGQT
jgi:DNA gyrase subunit A